LACFEANGFEEVHPPLVDAADAFAFAGEELPKIVGPDGQILALRADFTGPIARMVASRYAKQPSPLKLSYVGPVFRYRNGFREFFQAGVELFDAPPEEACLAIVQLTFRALETLGLSPFVVLGSNAILHALLPHATEALRHTLSRKSLRQLQQQCTLDNIPKASAAALEALLSLHGGSEVFSRAASLLQGGEIPLPQGDESLPWRNLPPLSNTNPAPMETALASLARLAECLPQGRVGVDLALVRPPSYYTDLVFDVFVEGVPKAVAGGGRYDALTRRFGAERTAVGVSFDVEALCSLPGAHGLKAVCPSGEGCEETSTPKDAP
jgi:ATP phosphoribosyltransferase regulatory subunit